MKTNWRTKIITETQRSFSFAIRKRKISFFCRKCEAQREMFTINEAANRTGKNWREIVRAIKTGEIHSSETAKGEIFVCAESLWN